MLPILLQIPLNSKRLESVRDLLQNWDFQQDVDAFAAALFEVFWKHLLADTFHDELTKRYWPSGGDRWFEVMRKLVKQPNSFWWDNKKTRVVESRNQIFRQAFAEAVDELERVAGKNLNQWRWGNLHTVTFRNLTLGESGIAFIEKIFNRGPFPAAGGSAILNTTEWNDTSSFAVTWLLSMRMIVDLAKLENSLTINSTGQSGHAFHPHYDDMIDSWRKIGYHSMLWDRDAVVVNTAAHLTLMP